MCYATHTDVMISFRHTPVSTVHSIPLHSTPLPLHLHGEGHLDHLASVGALRARNVELAVVEVDGELHTGGDASGDLNLDLLHHGLSGLLDHNLGLLLDHNWKKGSRGKQARHRDEQCLFSNSNNKTTYRHTYYHASMSTVHSYIRQLISVNLKCSSIHVTPKLTWLLVHWLLNNNWLAHDDWLAHDNGLAHDDRRAVDGGGSKASPDGKTNTESRVVVTVGVVVVWVVVVRVVAVGVVEVGCKGQKKKNKKITNAKQAKHNRTQHSKK